MSTVIERSDSIHVTMGAAKTAIGPARLGCVLGSCIGLVVYCPRLKMGGLAHIVMPSSNGKVPAENKYADVAVPALLQMFLDQGLRQRELVIRIAGGATMFGSANSLQIGDANATAVKAALKAANAVISGEHLGGKQGRRILLDCATGELAINIAGQTSVVL